MKRNNAQHHWVNFNTAFHSMKTNFIGIGKNVSQPFGTKRGTFVFDSHHFYAGENIRKIIVSERN